MGVLTGNASKRWMWIFLLVIIAGLGLASRASAQTLTNTDVVKMVQAKLSDALIISEIKHSVCTFDTSPTALIKLKQAGVSDKVLQAMTEARHAGARATGSGAASGTNAEIPLPQNYGLYAAADGKLLGFNVPVSTMEPQKVQIRTWQPDPVPLGPPSIEVQSIPVLPSGVSFVEYGQGNGIDGGRVFASPYIRRVSGSEGAWAFGGAIVRDVPSILLLERPVKGHTDEAIATPAKPLEPGVYWVRPVIGKPYLFAVGYSAGLEQSHCFDYSSPLTPCSGAPSPSGAPGVSTPPGGSQQAIQNNQASAVGTLRTINVAEITYASTYSVGYSRTLAQFGPPASGVNPTTHHAGLVDPQTASGAKNGYRFIYKSGPLIRGRIDTYTLVARPLQYGVTGINSFYTDQSGVIRMTKEDRQPRVNDPPIAGGPPPTPESAPGAQSPSANISAQVGATSAPSECANYDGCMRAGIIAFRDSNLSAAIVNFKGAAKLRPAIGGPWLWLGRSYLREGQTENLMKAWDKAISLGGRIVLGVCREVTFGPCQRGGLFISTKAVSFRAGRNMMVFDVPPSEVSAKGVLKSSLSPTVAFGLRTQRKNYHFDFFPIGVNCNVGLLVQCPAQGTAQQLAVANYVEQTIPKLASGALAVAPPPTPLSSPPASGTASNTFAMLPSFSPDGSKVAFIQFHIKQMSYGPSSSGFRVCISDLKKRTLSCLPESLPTDTGKVSVSPVRPVFTTDDKKVLFVAQKANFSCSAVYISRLDASGLRRLSGCDSSPNGIAVSPDGLSFAFNSASRLSMQKFSAGTATTVWKLPTGAGENSGEMDAGNYVFSPDATRMVFSAYDSKALLYTRNLKAQTTSNLVSYGSQLQESGWIFPAFAATGRQVTFSAAVGPVVPSPTGSAYYHEIFRVALNGGAPVRLTNDKRMDTEPRFADGGSRIIFASCGRQDAGLYSMGLNGGDKRLITHLSLRACNPSGVSGSLQAPHFDVSPDGQTLVFEDTGSRLGTDLYIVGFQGNGRVRLMDILNR